MSVLEHARGGTRAPVGRALNIKSRFDHFDALPMVVGDKELVKAVVAAAFSGADPSRGVRVALSSQRWRDALTGGRFKRVLLTGQGKASVEMAVAAVAALRDAPGVPALAGGLVLTKYDHGSSEASAALESAGVRVLRGGHPLPDEAGCAGTQELLSLAQQHATEDTIVVNLVSGGGSSLTSLPAKGLSLAEVQETVALLLSCGATIEELNTVRRHLTRFQGGRFAASLFPATVVSLVLSDVIGDPLHVIAGGPTAGDASTITDCLRTLQDPALGIRDKVPPNVLRYLASPDVEDTIAPGDPRLARTHNVVSTTNRDCLAAVAQACERELGYRPLTMTSSLKGNAADVAAALCGLARDAGTPASFLPAQGLPVCLLFGGETTVTLGSDGDFGRGGRNQELALAAAVELRGLAHVRLLALGTDGQDGPGADAAAGALVSGATCADADVMADAKRHLTKHDSFAFFQRRSGQECEHIVTGPSGSNVMDVIAIFIDAPAKSPAPGDCADAD